MAVTAVFEVDQSGKWEEKKPTAIGVAGARLVGIIISRRNKNTVSTMLGRFEQERNRSKKSKIIRMFTYTIFLSLREILREGDRISIDLEYEGHDDAIRELLIFLFSKFSNLHLGRDQIAFAKIGKESMAHKIAHQTFSGDRIPDKELHLDDYFALLDRTPEIRKRALLRRKRKPGQRDFHPPVGTVSGGSHLL